MISERAYQKLPVGLCHFDLDLRYIFINDWLAELNGISVEDHIGRSIEEVLPHLSEHVIAPLRKVIDTGEPLIGGEVTSETPSHPGELRTFKHSYVAVKSDDGSIIGLSCVVEDITRRKIAEQVRDEFIANISHELRTPLTSIKGSIGLIKSGKLAKVPEEIESMLDIAYDNSAQLEHLINDILDYEKTTSGNVAFQMESIDVYLLVEEAIVANTGLGHSHGISFVGPGSNESILVKGDKYRLLKVLFNLMSNAAKFSPNGEQVKLSVKGDMDTVQIAIKDNGPGIPNDFKDRVFERFVQIDNSDNRENSGTGLGLSISEAIIKQHGGSIGLESEVGTGSTFFFTLPVIK